MKNKILAALLSLVAAFALWMYVINVVDPNSQETFYNIPVVLTNDAALMDRNLMVTTTETPTVTLRLSGNRTDLARLNNSNISLQASLSGIYDAGEHLLSYQIYYPGDLPPNAFEVVSSNPGRISVNVEQRVRKEVPVRLAFTGSIMDEFMCDTQNPVLDNTSVLVDGPGSVVNQIEMARIDIDLTDRTQSIAESFRYTLCNNNGDPVDAALVTTDVAEINVTVKIQRTKEVPLVLTVVPGGGATRETSEITIEPATILVSGSDAALEQLTEINLGTVNLSEVTQDMINQSYPVRLPDNVTNLTATTEALVSIRFPQLAVRTFRITDIRQSNLPEGKVASVLTQELQITVRGPVELMNSIRETDLYVLLDLSEATNGTYTVRANVITGAGFEAAGAVGTYSVSISVQDYVEESTDATDGPGT